MQEKSSPRKGVPPGPEAPGKTPDGVAAALERPMAVGGRHWLGLVAGQGVTGAATSPATEAGLTGESALSGPERRPRRCLHCEPSNSCRRRRQQRERTLRSPGLFSDEPVLVG